MIIRVVISYKVNHPYQNSSPDQFKAITEELINQHPLTTDEIKEVCLSSWEDILSTTIGYQEEGLSIGKDIFPKPQIMAFFLHELVPHKLNVRHPREWHGEINASDKDIVYAPNDLFSIEIKTSSSARNIYGNRSYAQDPESSKKKKTGYYLAINFEKFSNNKRPKIKLIRFGWIDHSDWQGQRSATGQQARLSPEVETGKLLKIYELA